MKTEDPFIGQFTRGPFASIQPEPWPPAFVQLWQTLTGRKFEPALFVAYERVRAYSGYGGIAITPLLEQERVTEDPNPARAALPAVGAPVRTGGPVRAPERPRLGAPDPDDLGE